MRQYAEQRFTGERALFQSDGLELSYCTFADGESPLKESRNLIVKNTLFQWKYPLWYCHNVEVEDSTWFVMARAGVWYSDDVRIRNALIEAPKNFRRCRNLTLEQVDLPNAEETLWNCSHVSLNRVTARGDYFGMGCTEVEVRDFTLAGNYSFDGARDVTIRSAKMVSKDAFWNCENVTVYDSFISGEYFGWNSKNIRLVNCTVESEQGMCYNENLVMEHCRLLNTNLAFEYSSVDARIDSAVVSVKNPVSGRIHARQIGEIIFDNQQMRREDTEICVEKENE